MGQLDTYQVSPGFLSIQFEKNENKDQQGKATFKERSPLTPVRHS
jgi:hypothetical protein